MNNTAIILRKGAELDYLLKRDGVSDCRQTLNLNESSTLTFQLKKQSPKWRYFEGDGLTAEIDGRVYCILGEDGPSKQRDTSGLSLPVTMKEIWYKLGKKYITAYNVKISESSFDHIDTHMVVLAGKSADPLYIRGVRVTAPYAVGTAAYLFWCVLHGSGWSLDIRFDSTWPDGVFDLETDKKSVLENIEMLQSFFGGMLFWDSKSKRVALVDEKKYQQNDGFEVRYRHNEKGLTRTENRDIATRLYVYGNNNLNLAAVNGGKEYLDNFAYSSEVIEAIASHNDIYEQSSLLAWGKRQAELLGRPRYSYSVDLLLSPQKQGIPQPELGRMAKIIDADVVGSPVLQRILSIDQNVYLESDCNIIVGEVTDTFPKILKELGKAKDAIKSTVSGSGGISGKIVRGPTPALEKSNVHWEKVTTQTNKDVVATNLLIVKVEGELSTSISQTASAIRLEAKNTELDIRTTITQTAGAIRLEAVNTEKGLRSTITQTAGEIRFEVSDVKKGLQTQITQSANSITLMASDIKGHTSAINLMPDKITATVKDYTKGWESSITQSANRIALVVNASGIRPAEIVTSINNSSSSIKISADHVNISGLVTINSLKAGGTTVIDGSRITTGTISAKRISFDTAAGASGYFSELRVNKFNITTSDIFTFKGYRAVVGMSGTTRVIALA